MPIMVSAPSILKLDFSSTCSCRTPRPAFDARKPVQVRRCYVYGLLNACSVSIEVQKCPHCPQGYIGPECSALGIFNLNNRSLFALTLLDDYMAHFTRSETPFASWVASTACRYMNYQSAFSFIKEKAFRTAWFSYIRLVQLESDMRCVRCGDTPTVTIWDGVTLSFNRKNILPTLRPPTMTDEQSQTKTGIRPQQGLQLIPDKQLRKLIQTILTGETLSLPELPEDPDSERPLVPTAATKEMMDRAGLVSEAVIHLSAQSPDGLGTLFHRYFGFDYLSTKRKPPVEYKNLFLQVRM